MQIEEAHRKLHIHDEKRNLPFGFIVKHYTFGKRKYTENNKSGANFHVNMHPSEPLDFLTKTLKSK